MLQIPFDRYTAPTYSNDPIDVFRADVLRANGIAPRLKRRASTEHPHVQNPNDLTEEAKILRVRRFFCSCSIRYHAT